jgi:HK97 family phage major capsid protein
MSTQGIQALREKKKELARLANKQLADKGEQAWTAADQTQFDNYAADMEGIDRQIENHQKMLNLRAESEFTDAPRAEGDIKKTDRQQGYEIFLRKGLKDLNSEEMAQFRNAMSTTTGSQGGYTVQTDIAKTLVDALKDYAGMRRVSDNFTTAQGNEVDYPTTDGTNEIGELVAQNQPANPTDISFGTVPLNVFKFSSKIITVPIELLQDSQIDVVALVQKRIRNRIGRIQNQKFTQGVGVTEPFGLTTVANVGKIGATGQTSTIIYDDLVDIIDSIDIAYQEEGNLMFSISQPMRRVLRKLKDNNGRPIWTPSYDEGVTGDLTDILMGYPVNINNDLQPPGANNVSLTFGQHKKYMIRDALDVTLFRFDDSAYMSKGQVGFLGWARAGGNLLDLAAIKTYKHSAT